MAFPDPRTDLGHYKNRENWTFSHFHGRSWLISFLNLYTDIHKWERLWGERSVLKILSTYCLLFSYICALFMLCIYCVFTSVYHIAFKYWLSVNVHSIVGALAVTLSIRLSYSLWLIEKLIWQQRMIYVPSSLSYFDKLSPMSLVLLKERQASVAIRCVKQSLSWKHWLQPNNVS